MCKATFIVRGCGLWNAVAMIYWIVFNATMQRLFEYMSWGHALPKIPAESCQSQTKLCDTSHKIINNLLTFSVFEFPA